MLKKVDAGGSSGKPGNPGGGGLSSHDNSFSQARLSLSSNKSLKFSYLSESVFLLPAFDWANVELVQ